MDFEEPTMPERITAIVENGLLRPTVPLALPEGTRVEVTIDSPIQQIAPAKCKRTPAEVAEIVAKIAAMPNESPDADPNTSRDHDHYLYGAPRRS
jgi:predicted DNA-binding antitoxin AbrB/MazE fold protein